MLRVPTLLQLEKGTQHRVCFALGCFGMGLAFGAASGGETIGLSGLVLLGVASA